MSKRYHLIHNYTYSKGAKHVGIEIRPYKKIPNTKSQKNISKGFGLKKTGKLDNLLFLHCLSS